jgi:hypothetical protein
MSATRDAWVDCARAVRTETVLVERGLLGKLKRHGRDKFVGPCPVCGGDDRFAVNLRKGNGGVFHCRGCGAKGGDGIALIRFLNGCEFFVAVEELAGPAPDSADRQTDEDREARERRAREQREQIERKQRERAEREAAELRETVAYCDRLWRETEPLPGTAGERFFIEHRHLPISQLYPLDHVLRFHPGKRMVVALMTDPISAEPTGVHRIFLDSDGAKHGDRKMLGRAGIIRISPDDAVEEGLGLAEGIEKAVAILLGGWAPVWAAGSAGGIARFPILTGVQALTVFSDLDPVGTRAAHACAARWRDAGCEAVIRPPPLEEVA